MKKNYDTLIILNKIVGRKLTNVHQNNADNLSWLQNCTIHARKSL